jgi:hypothetical protein
MRNRGKLRRIHGSRSYHPKRSLSHHLNISIPPTGMAIEVAY